MFINILWASVSSLFLNDHPIRIKVDLFYIKYNLLSVCVLYFAPWFVQCSLFHNIKRSSHTCVSTHDIYPEIWILCLPLCLWVSLVWHWLSYIRGPGLIETQRVAPQLRLSLHCFSSLRWFRLCNHIWKALVLVSLSLQFQFSAPTFSSHSKSTTETKWTTETGAVMSEEVWQSWGGCLQSVLFTYYLLPCLSLPAWLCMLLPAPSSSG